MPKNAAAAPSTSEAAASVRGYDGGDCPGCREAVLMYVPPDRMVGGPTAYPALLLHYETKHPRLPVPPPHEDDTWETPPPAAEDWRPKDENAYRNHRPQPAGVWPPVRDVTATTE